MKNLAKFVVIVVLIVLAIFAFNSNKTKIEISFENNSGETTTDFFLYFQSSTTPESVPNIEANDTYVTTMKTKESRDNDYLRLFYHDYSGEKHDITLINSFNKGYKASIVIDIIEIDENGVYNLKTLIK